MRILLDTSVLIDLLRNRNGRRRLIHKLLQEGHSFGITAVNLAEIHAGIRPHERAATIQVLSSFECLAVDCRIAALAGDLRSEWARDGVTLHLADTMIAAAAIHHGMTLLTDNIKNFPMSGLKLLRPD